MGDHTLVPKEGVLFCVLVEEGSRVETSSKCWVPGNPIFIVSILLLVLAKRISRGICGTKTILVMGQVRVLIYRLSTVIPPIKLHIKLLNTLCPVNNF